jgi:phospholipid/cholesterol/gamma-HCH transport system substrate-binding protein
MGILESEGGVGGDLFAFDDRVKFSLDAWNFNSKEPNNLNTHMKATATWQITKLLFVNGGYDNFLNSSRASGFAGVGLRFDDDDMKYLMGSVPIPR